MLRIRHERPIAASSGIVPSIDRDELIRLYREYGPIVYRRAHALLSSDDEARDAMQEVFLRVLSEHHTFSGKVPILRWIYRITTNLCLNRLRARRSHPVVSDPDAILQLAVVTDEVDRRTVVEILTKVDALTQQIAVYYFFDGMKMEEIADLVGYSRKTVGKKLEAFRRKAHRMLTEVR